MLSTCTFTEIQENSTTLRKGGLLIKGQARSSRQPVHMILLVDTSGSMEMENKLKSVQKSIELLLPLLSSEDRVSLITFSDHAKSILKCVTPSPEQRTAIHYKINSFSPDGSTNMSAGLLESRELVEKTSSGRKQGILLLTDGHANIGVHSEEGLNDIVKRVLNDNPGLTLTTVAYGTDHNTELLTSMAKAGGGAYNVVHNLEDVATVFGDILGGLVSVSAQNVTVTLPAGAEPLTSYRVEASTEGTTVYVGDIYAEAEITVLFRSAPSLGALRIKGTDMGTLNILEESIHPTVLTDLASLPVSFVMADYKHRTAELLKDFRNSARPITFQEHLDRLITQIEEDERVKDHPLKPILVEDLRNALSIAKENRSFTQHETVEMAQHSAYYGLSKGLRTQTNPAPQRVRRVGNIQRSPVTETMEAPTTPTALPPPMMVTSPFANRIQSQFVQVMRTASNTVQQEESTIEEVD